jgi:pimeloyl-ACP methyl ester carboxylesterase
MVSMEFFQSQGVSIGYVDLRADEGANDPVILIHGFASNHLVNWVNTSWTRTLNRAGFRVIALDNRGHGQSGKLYAPEDYSAAIMAEDAEALMDHLGIARADVMGYSMGARIATFLALKSPERGRRASVRHCRGDGSAVAGVID